MERHKDRRNNNNCPNPDCFGELYIEDLKWVKCNACDFCVEAKRKSDETYERYTK